MNGLALLNSYHSYFAWLRLEWKEGLTQARQLSYEGVGRLMPAEKLAQIIGRLVTTQRQLRVL
ncbi:hypothetical protein [Paenibacillus koleovorans]|uniref:hypothetical protein n=1 Tax=Paenibacillus koleovorans TaxID=121608 RepID=UPI000FD94612|nr:hypothetical protein [Paenibacillus koleovorans]